MSYFIAIDRGPYEGKMPVYLYHIFEWAMGGGFIYSIGLQPDPRAAMLLLVLDMI